uniref:HMG box domain-containing protein n=1 Tax=Glossina pallidipes TaxID=7398 RepID=A0A1A9ZHS8_GLOPL
MQTNMGAQVQLTYSVTNRNYIIQLKFGMVYNGNVPHDSILEFKPQGRVFASLLEGMNKINPQQVNADWSATIREEVTLLNGQSLIIYRQNADKYENTSSANLRCHERAVGDLSRMVGYEWKNLPAGVKQNWEDRASRLNEESAARREHDEILNCSSQQIQYEPQVLGPPPEPMFATVPPRPQRVLLGLEEFTLWLISSIFPHCKARLLS